MDVVGHCVWSSGLRGRCRSDDLATSQWQWAIMIAYSIPLIPLCVGRDPVVGCQARFARSLSRSGTRDFSASLYPGPRLLNSPLIGPIHDHEYILRRSGNVQLLQDL